MRQQTNEMNGENIRQHGQNGTLAFSSASACHYAFITVDGVPSGPHAFQLIRPEAEMPTTFRCFFFLQTNDENCHVYICQINGFATRASGSETFVHVVPHRCVAASGIVAVRLWSVEKGIHIRRIRCILFST